MSCQPGAMGAGRWLTKKEGASLMLVIQAVAFFLSFLGISWLISDEPSMLLAFVGTAVVIGLTRLLNGRWRLF